MLAVTALCFALGTLLYTVLAIWRATVEGIRANSSLLALALLGMAVWCLASLTANGSLQVAAECLRNILWIVYFGFIVRDERTTFRLTWIAGLPWLLLVTALVRAASAALIVPGKADITVGLLISVSAALAFCIGGLVLLHSLYFATHRKASGFRLILIVLAILWAYDLNLYAIALLRAPVPIPLLAGRAVVALVLAPVLAIAARRKQRWSIALSRAMAFQSLSLVAIGGYFVLAATIAGTRPWLRGTAGKFGTLLALATLSGLAIVLLASSRKRRQVKVFFAKHLFEHRYDYRAEWLRFNATINSGSLSGLSPEQRAIKALSDLMEADGGLVFVRSGHDRLGYTATYDWHERGSGGQEATLPAGLLDMVEAHSHIMISPYYEGEGSAGEFPVGLPVDGSIWLAVPLVRMGALVGLVALGRPRYSRELDWEDFDLLKVLGQQIATYIADAQRQAELEEARQFEEFNRRFAFIVHDIKNVVSQLSLVVANAAEHGANPRFQADMASTLRNAVGKMTTLLSRLSVERAPPDLTLEPFDAMALLMQIATERQSQHPIAVAQGERVVVLADRGKLHTALDHLVQNAIEASAAGDVVMLSVHSRNDRGAIAVLDTAGGMTAEFIRTQLFKPFASTKPAGFGIGAGEARALVRQMDGELDVQSAEGTGTSFIVTLPLGDAAWGAGT